MSATTSLPYGSQHNYDTTTSRSPVDSFTQRQRWPQKQQVLQVIMPTPESSRHDRILTQYDGKKLSNTVASNDRRTYEDYYISRRYVVPTPPSQRRVGFGSQSRPESGRIGNRIGTEDLNVLCSDDVSSRIVTSLTQRRSPSPYVEGDSTSQHLNQHRLTTTPSPCLSPPNSTQTSSPPQSKTVVSRPSSSGPRPPTTVPRPSSTLPRPATNNPRPAPSANGGAIVFPDDQQLRPPSLPEECKGSTFCQDIGSAYPTSYINKLLQKDGGKLRGFFGEDVTEEEGEKKLEEKENPQSRRGSIIPKSNEVNITERINGPVEQDICNSVGETVFPKLAKNKEQKYKYIVNQDEYVQAFKVEKCRHDGPCALTEGFPLGYKTYCKQKFTYRVMIAVTEGVNGGSELGYDKFELPSCCVCVYIEDAMARLGVPSRKDVTPVAPAKKGTTTRMRQN